jgi:hypothetical protein
LFSWSQILNLAIQQKLAEASELCYYGLDSIAIKSHVLGLTFLLQHNFRNHSVSFFRFEKSTIVAFRGSCAPADWRTNLTLIPTKRPWGWVHLGFARAAEALWPAVREQVASSLDPQGKLYLTGHSLGGAMAVISALKVALELNSKVDGLVTFGQPPVAGRSTIRSLKAAGLQNYQRIVSSVDIVATGPIMPFYHAGSIQYFDANGRLHNNMSWIRYLKDAARLGWRFQITGQRKKRFIANYISLLRNAQTQVAQSKS